MPSGCLWKKTSARPIKQKGITHSPGVSKSMKSLKAKGVFWESITACLPCSHTPPQTSAAGHCWRPTREQDGHSDTLMSELCNRKTTTLKYLQSSHHDHIQTFHTHVSWRNAINRVLQVGNWGIEQLSKFSKTPMKVWGHCLNHCYEVRSRSWFF